MPPRRHALLITAVVLALLATALGVTAVEQSPSGHSRYGCT